MKEVANRGGLRDLLGMKRILLSLRPRYQFLDPVEYRLNARGENTVVLDFCQQVRYTFYTWGRLQTTGGGTSGRLLFSYGGWDILFHSNCDGRWEYQVSGFTRQFREAFSPGQR